MFIQSEVSLLYSTPGYLAGITVVPTLHLYTTPVTITRNSVPTDFTEADFTGYNSVTLSTFAPVYWQSQGAAVQFASTVAVFQPAGTITVTNICYGYYVQCAGTPNFLLGAEQFASPIPMATVADQINIVVAIGLSDANIGGQIF
jgi:hypothetical protein